MTVAICPRCGRPIGGSGQTSTANHTTHMAACDRLPAPAELLAEYLANITNTVPSLARKYGVSTNFTVEHLLFAGLTRQQINERYHKYTRRERAAEGHIVMPPGGRPCRRCTILVFEANPPYPYQQNVGGFCSACVQELKLYNQATIGTIPIPI